ncbi:protein of unknown function [Thermomonospora echinospora]|uniref:DUF4145 domain-containing protein n=2 Tax=Thermomonospora echinospora TaxID=1992 RepID=A0A1H6E896_9ACTN|nr:protein of unknown function [Thermomonospora echinospora]
MDERRRTLRCLKYELYGEAALSMRKIIEAICATGGYSTKDMSLKAAIDNRFHAHPRLAAWAHQIRFLGNDHAHFGHAEITKADVYDALALLNAIYDVEAGYSSEPFTELAAEALKLRRNPTGQQGYVGAERYWFGGEDPLLRARSRGSYLISGIEEAIAAGARSGSVDWEEEGASLGDVTLAWSVDKIKNIIGVDPAIFGNSGYVCTGASLPITAHAFDWDAVHDLWYEGLDAWLETGEGSDWRYREVAEYHANLCDSPYCPHGEYHSY